MSATRTNHGFRSESRSTLGSSDEEYAASTDENGEVIVLSQVPKPIPEAPRTENMSLETTSAGTRTTNGNVEQVDEIGSNNSTAARSGDIQLQPDNTKTRKLSVWDVAAFIINKMVGTGILTTPPTILKYTQGDRNLAVGLWALGFVYTIVWSYACHGLLYWLVAAKLIIDRHTSMFVYLRFCRAWFFNGGELIFLDELYYLWLPKLLPFVVYGFFTVVFVNTGTNANQIGRHAAIIRNPELGLNINDLDNELDRPFQTFIAIVAITAICLLNYFSVRIGRTSNAYLALFKVVMLFVLFVKSVLYFRSRVVPFGEPLDLKHWLNHANNTLRVRVNTTEGLELGEQFGVDSSAYAMLTVLFSFLGWENAAFVLGEVKDMYTLETGFVIAVVVVGVLYNLINGFFIFSFQPYNQQELLELFNYTQSNNLTGPASSTNLPDLYLGVTDCWGRDSKMTRIWAALTIVSAIGNIIAVVYTSARVKRVFGRAMVIPWSNIWKRLSVGRKTPTGGLLLQWIFGVVLIVASTAVADRSVQIFFPGNIQNYGYCIMALFLSVGLFLLPYTITNQTDDYVYADRKHPDEHIEPIEYGVVSGGRPKWGVRRIWELLLAFCFFCFSLFIVVMAPFPMKIFKSPVPGYVFFALNFGLITIAIAYYYGIMYVWRDGRNFCGVKMSWEETFDDYSGQRLNLVFTPDANENNSRNRFLYWLFSGEKWPGARQNPIEPIGDTWRMITDYLAELPQKVYKYFKKA